MRPLLVLGISRDNFITNLSGLMMKSELLLLYAIEKSYSNSILKMPIDNIIEKNLRLGKDNTAFLSAITCYGYDGRKKIILLSCGGRRFYSSQRSNIDVVDEILKVFRYRFSRDYSLK